MLVAIDILGNYVQAGGPRPPFGIVRVVPYNSDDIYDVRWARDQYAWERRMTKRLALIKRDANKNLKRLVAKTERRLFGDQPIRTITIDCSKRARA